MTTLRGQSEQYFDGIPIRVHERVSMKKVPNAAWIHNSARQWVPAKLLHRRHILWDKATAMRRLLRNDRADSGPSAQCSRKRPSEIVGFNSGLGKNSAARIPLRFSGSFRFSLESLTLHREWRTGWRYPETQCYSKIQLNALIHVNSIDHS